MKTLAKWILAGLAFALGVMAAEHCDAYTIRSIRSLNAAAAVVNGASFDGSTSAQMPPQGGGIQWNVLLTGTGFNTGTSITVQFQAQMTDGTWVPVAPSNGTTGTVGANYTITSTGFSTTLGQAFQFFGPYINFRVAITAYTTPGSITADISVMY